MSDNLTNLDISHKAAGMWVRNVTKGNSKWHRSTGLAVLVSHEPGEPIEAIAGAVHITCSRRNNVAMSHGAVTFIRPEIYVCPTCDRRYPAHIASAESTKDGGCNE